MKEFSLGAVLSVTGNCLLCDIGQVYEILNYMTGTDLSRHQLPRAARACKPVILDRYPELASVDDSAVTQDNWREFLAEQVAKFGSTRTVEPLAVW